MRVYARIHPVLNSEVERDSREFLFKDLQPLIRLSRGSLSARYYIRNDGEVRFKAELHTFMEVIEERSRIPFLTLFPCGVTSVVNSEIGIFRRVPPMIYYKEPYA